MIKDVDLDKSHQSTTAMAAAGEGAEESPRLRSAAEMAAFWGDVKATDGERRLVVVGHRGVGKNLPPGKELPPGSGTGTERGSNGRPSVRENTILSLNRAAEHGADFVEFDAQVTSDGHAEPKRVSDLTLQEFLMYGPEPLQSATPVGAGESSRKGEGEGREGGGVGGARKGLERRSRGGPAYNWQEGEEDGLCTLAQAFQSVSPGLGFNVEVKFASDNDEPEETGPQEIERMLSAIFRVVEATSGSRRVYYSTFHPDAAVELKRRQSTYPVFFLTDGGGHLFKDERMNTVKAAIELCTSNGLEGIVCEVKALLANPQLATDVKQAGLQLLTYGDLNNDADALRFQQFHDIDGVIVDHVLEMVNVAKRSSRTSIGRPPFGRFGPTV
eukprot:jgi/Mesen1/10678/ME000009S10469